MAQNAFLHSRMMKSKTIFYRQIPCELIDGECFIRDYRTCANVIKQVHRLISLGDYSMWWNVVSQPTTSAQHTLVHKRGNELSQVTFNRLEMFLFCYFIKTKTETIDNHLCRLVIIVSWLNNLVFTIYFYLFWFLPHDIQKYVWFCYCSTSI